MNLIEIGSFVPVQPVEYHMDIIDMSSDNSGDDLSGYTHKDVIRQKRKLYYKWGKMSLAECSELLTALAKGTNLPITYLDTQDGKIETRLFLIGDRTHSPIIRTNENEIWVDGLGFNFNEHGGDQP